MSPINAQKRTLDHYFTVTSSPNKRIKMDPPLINGKKRTLDYYFRLTPASNRLLDLPPEIINLILFGIDDRSLLNFEVGSKKCQHLTSKAWKDRKGSNYTWAMTQKLGPSENPDKLDYRIMKALTKYIIIEKHPDSLEPDLKRAQEIFTKYGELIQRFPLLSKYMSFDLQRLAGATTYLFDSTIEAEFNKTLLQCKHGGELLCKGLLLTQEANQNSLNGNTPLIRAYFLAAIQKGVSFASSLALGPIIYGDGEYIDAVWELAAEAANLGDKRALESLLKIDGKDPLEKLANQRKEDEEWEDADRLYTSLLGVYLEVYRVKDEDPPAIIFAKAAIVKSHLRDWQGADELFTRALEAYTKTGEAIPYEVYIEASVAKACLGDFKEADNLYEKASAVAAAAGKTFSGNTLAGAGGVKNRLSDWNGADALFTRALEAYTQAGETPDALFYAEAAFTKEWLSDWVAANELYDQAFAAAAAANQTLAGRSLTNAAEVKSYLLDWEGADQLFSLALKAYTQAGETPPFEVYATAGEAKAALSHWEEADKLFSLALAGYTKAGETPPFEVYATAGLAKVALSHWEEADKLYDQASAAAAATNKALCMGALAHAAEVKRQLAKIASADKFD